jgi:hypothetical protein
MGQVYCFYLAGGKRNSPPSKRSPANSRKGRSVLRAFRGVRTLRRRKSATGQKESPFRKLRSDDIEDTILSESDRQVKLKSSREIVESFEQALRRIQTLDRVTTLGIKKISQSFQRPSDRRGILPRINFACQQVANIAETSRRCSRNFCNQVMDRCQELTVLDANLPTIAFSAMPGILSTACVTSASNRSI